MRPNTAMATKFVSSSTITSAEPSGQLSAKVNCWKICVAIVATRPPPRTPGVMKALVQ